MAPAGTKKDAKTQTRYLLRANATASAACGFIINIIAITSISRVDGWHAPKQLLGWAFLPLLGSLAWDIVNLTSDMVPKAHRNLESVGDFIAFFGFLAILVANGIIATDLTAATRYHISEILLLAYNSFPWIICADLHLCLAFYPILATMNFSKLPRIKLEWPEEASAPLLADDNDDEDEDMEAQPRRNGASHRGDHEEESPLLGSS